MLATIYPTAEECLNGLVKPGHEPTDLTYRLAHR